LAVEILFFTLTEDVALFLWIPCMMVGVALMLLLLWRGTTMNLTTAGYYCARAFLLAEFAASLEWQLYYYTVHQSSGHVHALSALYLIVIYGGVYTFAYWLEKRWISQSQYNDITLRELLSAAVIGVAAFGISNLSFNVTNTPFTSSIATDIFNIRTLVDLGGLAILYAYHLQRSDLRSRYELQITNTLLASQYAQYQQSQETIDLVNHKYHDLKHQIQVLRRESDSTVRNSYLDQMEEDILRYEAQNKTGNAVLDTILTSKVLTCQKKHILLTSVADGSLLDFMATMDICTIFGNGLDNAIEYEETLPDPEKRLIQLSVSRQKQFLMIRISNYFEGTLSFQDGLPQTTKGDRAFHGYGVKSIRSCAEKYGGSMSVDVVEQTFSVQILIPLP
jgi:hypothetical protein